MIKVCCLLIQVREINSGHIAGCLMHHNAFVKAIVDTFAKLMKSDRKSPGLDDTGSFLSSGNPLQKDTTNHTTDVKMSLPLITFVKAFVSKT